MTLGPELMGALSLLVMWTATILIVMVAAGDALKLARRRRALADRTLVGTIVGGELARLEVEEVGRAKVHAKARTILFHPRKQAGRLEGGVLRVGEREILVPPLGPEAAEVWPKAAREDGEFSSAYAEASRTKGVSRVVRHVYGPGERVFVAGELKDGALAPLADPTRPGEAPTILVAAEDPRAWITRRLALSVLSIFGFLASAALVTGLAFAERGFGGLTELAAVLGLAQFLGAQPLGVLLRDVVSTPDRRPVHHDWVES